MATCVWKGTTTTWATGSNWVAGSAPTAADDAVFGTGVGATNNNCTTAAGDVCRSLTVDNAYTGTLTLASSATALGVGDGSGGAVTLGTGMTLASAGSNATLILKSTANNGGVGWSFTPNGIVVPFRVQANGAGGRWTLQGNITISASNANALRVTAGTFDANNKNVSFTGTAQGGWAVDGGTLIFGTGTWSYAVTATVTFANYTSGTVTGGSETHSLTGTGNLVRTFAGGSQSYGALQHNGATGTGSLTVTGANTFASLGCVSGRTIRLPASSTTTVTGPNGLGSIVGTLNSATAATAATISLTSLFVSIIRATGLQDLTVTPAGHAYGLSSTANTSGNTGITFGGIAPGWGLAA